MHGKALGGLVRRRYYEWMLFQYGYDVVSDSYYQVGDFYEDDGESSEGELDSEMLELQKKLATYIGLEDRVSNLTLSESSKIEGLNSADKAKVDTIGAKWYATENVFKDTNPNWVFECTWWTFARASQYLEAKYGKGLPKYVGFEKAAGYWKLDNGQFEFGMEPRAHSIIQWKQGTAGHVAFVEAVDSQYMYISHAGDGVRWFGISKIPLSGEIWKNSNPKYVLTGFAYLDSPKDFK